MNKEEAIKKIREFASQIDFSKETMEIRKEKDLRFWFQINYKKIGIDKLLELRGINTKKPDFKVQVDNVELEVDLVLKSYRFFDKHRFVTTHTEFQSIDLVFCCVMNSEFLGKPFVLLPLKYIDVAKEKRKENRSHGIGLKQIWVNDETKSKLLKINIFGTTDEKINSLVDFYLQNKYTGEPKNE